MVKVLLAVFLLGFSFSGQAHEEECDLNKNMVIANRFSAYTEFNESESNSFTRRAMEALESAKQKALDKCREKEGYSRCEIVEDWFTRRSGMLRWHANANAVGEKALELTDERRKSLLCENINQCIGNGKGSYEQLEALFKLNKCSDGAGYNNCNNPTFLSPLSS